MAEDSDLATWKADFRDVILSFGSALRFTQDSPVLTDVWMSYAEAAKGARVPLILVPHYRTRPADLVRLLGEDMARDGDGQAPWPESEAVWRSLGDRGRQHSVSRIVALSNDLSVSLDFDELLRVAVPLTEWWQKIGLKPLQSIDRTVGDAVSSIRDATKGPNDNGALSAARSKLIELFRASNHKDVWRFFTIAAMIVFAGEEQGRSAKLAKKTAAKPEMRRWKLIGGIAAYLKVIGDVRTPLDEVDRQVPPANFNLFLACASQLLGKLKAIKADRAEEEVRRQGARTYGIDKATSSDGIGLGENPVAIWRINLNRPVQIAIAESRRTVKADAAARVFEHDLAEVAWAVIDSGIDASHLAFQRRDRFGAPSFLREESSPEGTALSLRAERFRTRMPKWSRIVASYDFIRLRHFMDGDIGLLVPQVDDRLVRKLADGDFRELGAMPFAKAVVAYLTIRFRFRHRLDRDGDFGKLLAGLDERDLGEIAGLLSDIERRVLLGREVDWELLEPIVAVLHDQTYSPPRNPHGTHVAGILCGDLRRGELTRPEPGERTIDNDADPAPFSDLRGVCPELRVYDLRVCNDQGGGEEFIVLAALQFIGYLNRDRDKMRVQGVNLSLSLRHDVENFACGRTPVCLECERLIGNGVVVVAAAGNHGFNSFATSGGKFDTYLDMTITDPGNAAGVITVGATHRRDPHAYGVSYFSSRGPTGDGRLKPDLVAPGEKIVSAVPDNRIDTMDGTSMAAPHVSGAAAMLMARHPELIRDPIRIKRILCETATDLGRERRFQGAGVVDILRALQSV